MTTFAKLILKLLTEYKSLIKKLLPQKEWSEKMTQLDLKRKALRHDDEIALYYKAQRVLEDTRCWLHRNSTSHWHSGLDEFYNYLLNILEEYAVINNRIVHTSRQVSCAMVEAFQLIRLERKRNKLNNRRLDRCAQIIAQYGSREQQEMFSKALKSSQDEDINFFLPLLDNFEKYLHRFLSNEEEAIA